VKAQPLHFFFAGAFCFLSPLSAEILADQTSPPTLTDVDGTKLSTGGGHITTVVLTTETDIDRARAVGERTPDQCLGNPAYQMITIISFQKKHSRPMQIFLNSIVRNRVEKEARQLQKRYDQLKITRDARQDVHVVADFDRTIAAQLGKPDGGFHVLIFGKNGELIKKWDEVPSADELAAALK
jgi:hypothetical protein